MLQTASPFLAQKLKQRRTHYDAYVGAQVHIMIIKLRKLHYTHVFQWDIVNSRHCKRYQNIRLDSPLFTRISTGKENLFEGFRLIDAETVSQCVVVYFNAFLYAKFSRYDRHHRQMEYSFIHFATLVSCVGAFAE